MRAVPDESGPPRPRPRSARRGAARRAGAALGLASALLLAGCASTPSGGAGGAGSGASGSGGGSGAGASSAPTPRRAPAYVALGDSYSSAPLVPVTDVAGGCFRSSANYPALVASALRARLTDRTCAGATTADLTRPQRPGIPAQDSALGPRTRVVTLGMGGNDERVFSTLVNTCSQLRTQDPTGSPCRDAMQTTSGDRLLAALDRTQGRLETAVRTIRTKAPSARVLLVGYPHIVAAGRPCAALPLATGDYAWAESVNRRLSLAVERAARATGATYVDVWTASRGHDICSSDPWVNGVRTDQQRALAFHPFAVEQQAVARLVERTLAD